MNRLFESLSLATRARTLLPHVSRIGGALLVLVGAYVAYYGVYELRLFFGDADPADPVQMPKPTFRDRFFKLSHAQRLAEIVPDAKIVEIQDARTFSPLDQPEAVAGAIASFVAAPSGARG